MKEILHLILSLTLLSGMASAERLSWVGDFEGRKELDALPTCKILKEENGHAFVQVTNETNSPLSYFGYEKDRPQRFAKRKIEGKWQEAEWEYCGTGRSQYALPPNESVILRVHSGKGPIQIFALFINPKNSKQLSFVKIFER